MPGSAQNIVYARKFLRATIRRRLSLHSGKENEPVAEPPRLLVTEDSSPLAEMLMRYQPGLEECVLLFLALYPHIQPNLLDQLIRESLPQGGDFPEIGGVKGVNHREPLPTGETARFVIAGEDLDRR